MLAIDNPKMKLQKFSFIEVSKIIKYLEINLTKEIKDLYIQSYKTLLKEMKQYSNKWKDFYVCELEDLILLK